MDVILEPPFRAFVREAVKLLGSQSALGTAIGRSQQQVHRLCATADSISAEDALAIHTATQGHIPASAMRPDLWRGPEAVPDPTPAEPAA